jgi:hypothetical protein
MHTPAVLTLQLTTAHDSFPVALFFRLSDACPAGSAALPFFAVCSLAPL